MNLRNRLGVVFACAAITLAPCAAMAGERSEVGIEIGAVAAEDALRPIDGDEISPIFGFKFIGGVHDGRGWFVGLNYFKTDAPALDDKPTAFIGRIGPEWILNAPGSRARFFLDFGGGFSNYEFAGDRALRAIATLGLGQRINIGSAHTIGWELRANQDLTDNGTIEARMLQLQALLSLNWGSSTPPADTDGDGVIDRRDDCPGTPRGAIVDDRGCPQDSDGDGVWDGIDQCPDTPKGWPVDQNGCPSDSDGDGVPDGQDKCPDTPKGATVDDNGCPTDSDGDGVYDGIDRCADTPMGATVDDNGCPADSDGDGVHNGIDRCADTPKGATVDDNGCPMDSDGDGVFDGIDRCPDTPKGATVDDSGCPMDSDGDGVFDGIDRCPDTPKGTPVDDNGCPSFGPKTARGAFVLRGVNFELDSATLASGSSATLDLVVQTLAAYPEANAEIGGHTDTQGDAAYNQKLSEKRANSVRDYLVSKGIDPARLTAKGYGESIPIAEGNSKEAHAQNRRVEVKKTN